MHLITRQTMSWHPDSTLTAIYATILVGGEMKIL